MQATTKMPTWAAPREGELWAGDSGNAGASLGPPSDHPVSLDHPEGDYFGGLLLRA